MLYFVVQSWERGWACMLRYTALLKKAAVAGTQSFRVFGDVWQMRKKGSAQKLAEYEAACDQFIVRR